MHCLHQLECIYGCVAGMGSLIRWCELHGKKFWIKKDFVSQIEVLKTNQEPWNETEISICQKCLDPFYTVTKNFLPWRFVEECLLLQEGFCLLMFVEAFFNF